MAFALSDVKKTVTRNREIRPYLATSALAGKVELAVEYFEAMAGRPKRDFVFNALVKIFGDYRIARCFMRCLLQSGYFYEYRNFPDVVGPAKAKALGEKGLSGPQELRLFLYDRVNESGGYLPSSKRDQFLEEAARGISLSGAGELSGLLDLDAEENAILRRNGKKPAPDSIIDLFNRNTLSALLSHSSSIALRFGKLTGSAMRKIYFLCKLNYGVACDFEKENLLRLYGPQDLFASTIGAPKYGDNLSSVVLAVLSSEEVLELSATVLSKGKSYLFKADSLGLFRSSEPAITTTTRFDSVLEENFYRTFCGMEQKAGWRLLREPEPLRIGDGGVFIPDFAFVRGAVKVYFEIIGFWTKSYLERKLRKLDALGSDQNVILAINESLLSPEIEIKRPFLTYSSSIWPGQVLGLLDEHFSDFGGRLALIDAGKIEKEILAKGFLPEEELLGKLNCHSRAELMEAAKLFPGLVYVPDFGLCAPSFLDEVHSTIKDALPAKLGQVASILPGYDTKKLQALISHFKDFKIVWPSLDPDEARIEARTG